MNANTVAPTPPWYRQFWPWFLLALPAAALIAGFATLAIALRNGDEEIGEPHTKRGLIVEPAQPRATGNAQP